MGRLVDSETRPGSVHVAGFRLFSSGVVCALDGRARAMLVEQTLIALVIMPACIAFEAILSGNGPRVCATRTRMT
jgi:hypothetical protein